METVIAKSKKGFMLGSYITILVIFIVAATLFAPSTNLNLYNTFPTEIISFPQLYNALPFLKEKGVVVIANVAGKTLEDYGAICAKLDGRTRVFGYAFYVG